MTLDEAIQHCIEVAEDEERNTGWFYDKENVRYKKKCSKCAEEHRQLAEWLRELKQYKEQDKPQGEYEVFAKWVATEIFDENWEYNKDAFAEIACRKVAKMGIVRVIGDEWELAEPHESEGSNADSN